MVRWTVSQASYPETLSWSNVAISGHDRPRVSEVRPNGRIYIHVLLLLLILVLMIRYINQLIVPMLHLLPLQQTRRQVLRLFLLVVPQYQQGSLEYLYRYQMILLLTFMVTLVQLIHLFLQEERDHHKKQSLLLILLVIPHLQLSPLAPLRPQWRSTQLKAGPTSLKYLMVALWSYTAPPPGHTPLLKVNDGLMFTFKIWKIYCLCTQYLCTLINSLHKL